LVVQHIFLLTSYAHYGMFVCKTEDITYDAAPSPQHPTQYEDGLIQCRVSGQPVPSVSWRYSGRRIHTGWYTLVFLLLIVVSLYRKYSKKTCDALFIFAYCIS